VATEASGPDYAATAAMVNDILAAAPGAPDSTGDATPSSSEEGAETDAPDEIPITPDFFTARPQKRFRLKR